MRVTVLHKITNDLPRLLTCLMSNDRIDPVLKRKVSAYLVFNIHTKCNRHFFLIDFVLIIYCVYNLDI